MGMKTEEEGMACETKNGGTTEIIGAAFVIGHGTSIPAVINDNSSVSVYAATAGMACNQTWPIAVREIQKSII